MLLGNCPHTPPLSQHQHLGQNIGLGKGLVGSFPKMYINDPIAFGPHEFTKNFQFLLQYLCYFNLF